MKVNKETSVTNENFKWLGIVALTQFLVTLTFAFILQFGNLPEQRANRWIVYWAMLALLSGVPWLRFVHGSKTERFLYIVFYVPFSLFVLMISVGVLAVAFGWQE